MIAGFVAGVFADYCLGWLSYAAADQAALNRQRLVIVVVGGLITAGALVVSGKSSLASLLPVAAAGVVLAVLEFARAVHRRVGDVTHDERSNDLAGDR